MTISVIRILSRSQEVDEGDTPQLDAIKKFIDSLADEKQDTSFHLTFHAKYLQMLIESDPVWLERLRALSERKKILIGPWYLFPNDCLASGESIIRNLFYGSQTCFRIGSVMKVGYSAFICNNNSQFPQILNGFNIDTLVVPVSASQHLPQEFYWEGSDGNKALVISSFVIDTEQPIDDRVLNEILEYFANPGKKVYGIPVIIIEDMASDDRNKIVADIEAYLQKDNTIKIEHISLPDHFWRIKEITSKQSVKTLTREVIPDPKNPVWKTTIKCLRIISKNSHAEQGLIFYAEPWDVIRQRTIGENSFELTEQLWKSLLSLQFNTYNCSNRDHSGKRIIRSNYLKILKEIEDFFTSSMQKILSNINLPDLNIPYFCILNPLPYTRNQIVRMSIQLPKKIASEDVIIEDLTGNKVPCTVISKTEIVPVFDDQNLGERQQYDCVLEFKNIPAMGYKTYQIVPVRRSPAPLRKNIITNEATLENDFIRVTINKDGRWDVYSKETGVVYKNLGYICDKLWSDSEAKQSPEVMCSKEFIPTITQIENNTLIGSYKIEYDWIHKGLSNSKNTKITVILSLDRLSRSVNINIEVVDKLDGHQIEYYFPINFLVDHIYSDVNFDIQDVLPIKNIHSLDHYQVSMNTLIGVCDEVAGFAVISKELRSARITTRKGAYLSFTLVNKPNLAKGSGGTTILNYSFCFYPYVGGWENGLILRDSYNKIFDIKTLQLSKTKGSLPTQMEFLSISPANLCFSSFKQSQNGNAILRFFNPTNDFIEGQITTYYPLRSASIVSLEEYQVEDLPLKNPNLILLLVPPKKIITIELRFAQ